MTKIHAKTYKVLSIHFIAIRYLEQIRCVGTMLDLGVAQGAA